MLCSDGYYIVKMQYDSGRHKIHEAYYGLNGETVMSTSSYATVDWAYNEQGEMVSVTYYDLDGEKVDVP